MRIRNLWLPLWLGLVGGSLFAAALWLPAPPWPSSDRAARAGPPAAVLSIDVGRLARAARSDDDCREGGSHRATAKSEPPTRPSHRGGHRIRMRMVHLVFGCG